MNKKEQMREAAILYYEKKYTQNEIAATMNLTRQTVSKLLNDAIIENVVEIKIHNPETLRTELEREFCRRFELKNTVICNVSTNDEALCQLMTVKTAAEYIMPLIEEGKKKIALSWGRTIQMLIPELWNVNVSDNIVFPLFGATDQVQSYYLSNELARSFADKINAKVKYAWFPYCADSKEDCEFFKKTSYFKKLHDLWCDIDIAIVGIGNDRIVQEFEKIFGYNKNSALTVGDISTHFFDKNGQFFDMYENTLCASKENLKNAKETIAVACGKDKIEAIAGALRTQIIDTLITDEYTAKKILSITQ